jgi:Tol biopolymer transport system component
MLAFTRTVAGNADIWLMDTERSTLRRLTTDPGAETLPIWSPDGRRLVYISSRTGIYDLYEQPVDGSEPAKVLLSSPSPKNCFDWSSDGRYIIYSVFAGGGRDLWVLPMSGDRKPFPVAQSPFEENAARFSPDGHWITYQSNESGRTEVYVQPFPGTGGNVQVSIDGGAAPQYRGDGRELFFRGRGDKLMAASLSFAGSTVRIGVPHELFSMPPGVDTEVIAAADGQRFLSKAVTKDASPITLLFNWKPGASRAAQ